MMRAIHLRAEAVEEEVRGHLEQEIGEEEDAGAKAEHGGGEAERLVHGQRGEADIHPIEISDEIADDQERDQSCRNLADRSGLWALHDRSLPVRELIAHKPCKCGSFGPG